MPDPRLYRFLQSVFYPMLTQILASIDGLIIAIPEGSNHVNELTVFRLE